MTVSALFTGGWLGDPESVTDVVRVGAATRAELVGSGGVRAGAATPAVRASVGPGAGVVARPATSAVRAAVVGPSGVQGVLSTAAIRARVSACED